MDKVEHLERVIDSAKELIKVYKKAGKSGKGNKRLEETYIENTVRLVKNIQGAIEVEDFMKIAFQATPEDPASWKQILGEINSKFMVNNYSCFSDIKLPGIQKFKDYTPWSMKPFNFGFKNKLQQEHGPVKLGSFINWIFYSMVLYPWHSRCYTDPEFKNIQEVYDNSIEVGGL